MNRLLLLSPLLLITAILTGCVSTEELYARYDNALCPVVIPQQHSWHWAVLFPYNRSEITEDQLTKLQDNLELLKEHPQYRVALRGFSDSVASQRYNLPLSQKRAEAVARWLISQGLSHDRIDLVWAGKTLPLTPPGNGKDEPVNRRVEMLLLDGNGKPVPVALNQLSELISPLSTNTAPATDTAPAMESIR